MGMDIDDLMIRDGLKYLTSETPDVVIFETPGIWQRVRPGNEAASALLASMKVELTERQPFFGLAIEKLCTDGKLKPIGYNYEYFPHNPKGREARIEIKRSLG